MKATSFLALVAMAVYVVAVYLLWEPLRLWALLVAGLLAIGSELLLGWIGLKLIDRGMWR